MAGPDDTYFSFGNRDDQHDAERKVSIIQEVEPMATEPEEVKSSAASTISSTSFSVSIGLPVIHPSSSLAELKRYNVMADFLHERVDRNHWLESYHSDMYYGTPPNLGAFVRRPDGSYASTATNKAAVSNALETLQPEMAFTMSFTAISMLLTKLEPNQDEIHLGSGFLLPIIESLAKFVTISTDCDKNFGACLCMDEHFILVWGSNPTVLLAKAAEIETLVVGSIWGGSTLAQLPAPAKLASRRNQSIAALSEDVFAPRLKPALQRPSTADSRLKSPKRLRTATDNSTPRSVSFSNPTVPRSVSFSDPVTPTRTRFSREHSRRTSNASNDLPVIFYETEMLTLSDPDSHPVMSVPPEMQRRPTIAHVRAMSQSSAGKEREFRHLSIWDESVLQNAGIPAFTAQGAMKGTVSDATLRKMGILEKALAIEENGGVAVDLEANEVVREEDMQKNQKRPFLLLHSWLVAIAVALVVTLELWCIADLIEETALDGTWERWALVLTIPMFGLFSLFFMIVISGCLFQLLVPIGCLGQNSAYYSAIAPKVSEHLDLELPHITIEMPVYKEGLSGVIIPTVTSLLKAVRHYESYGGTATIYINDDGMQLVSPELQEARKTFYEINRIAWCARPGHCSTPGDKFYLRKGKFKKASNMNFCLDFSLRVEAEFIKLRNERCAEMGIDHLLLAIDEEDEIYEEARANVIELEGGRVWSGGDVRIGEYILIIDSDTVVPEDCLISGALELTESPEVAIIQHASGVMNVTGSLFENGITYFTNLIYTNIVHSVGSGDVGPFVGHNAFLRWKAIQSVSYQEDGRTKFWSECHVSEDFDVSLRLQMAGFIIRLAGYHDGGFKEGVSLTVYDELARWEKYAYGCNELVFHPFKDWWKLGPITPLFRKFLGSNIKITSKFTILAYIGTYYAIAAGFPLSVINYVLLGLGWNLDNFYQSSWHIWVGLAVVYNLISPISFAMLRYRMKQTSYLGALWDCIKWLPLFLVFFSGLSFHLSKALLCHFLSINMEWTTTAKEVDKAGFRLSLLRIFKDFRWMYVCMLATTGAMLFFAFCPYPGWTIQDFTVIVPLANQVLGHLLLPFFALGLL